MALLKIILITLGIVSVVFGYFIYFKGKYNLINGFKDDYKASIKTELYGKRVGLIEFILGIVLVLIGLFIK